MRKTITAGLLATLCACSANTPPAAPVESAAPTPDAPATNAPTPPATVTPVTTAPPEPTAPTTAPAFADKVWRVDQSSGVEAGSTYTFLHDGALVIQSPNATPATGSWSYDGGKLTMVEEGMAYPTDIVSLDAGHFTIRSHNPGGTVDIAMSAVAGAPLPVPQGR